MFAKQSWRALAGLGEGGKDEICLLSMNLEANEKTERQPAIAQHQPINPYSMAGSFGVNPNVIKSLSLVFLQTILQGF